MFPLVWSSHFSMVSLNIVKNFLCGTILSSGGIFACEYLYTLTYIGLNRVRQENNIYFRKLFRIFFVVCFVLLWFFSNLFALYFFLGPKSEVLLYKSVQISHLHKKSASNTWESTPKCASLLLVSLIWMHWVHFKEQAETRWGMNGSTSNTGGSPSRLHSFSSPSTCFSLCCIE